MIKKGRTKQEEPAVWGRGAYLGGHPNEVPRRRPDGRDEAEIAGHIAMNRTAIYIAPDRRRGRPSLQAVIPWSSVAFVSNGVVYTSAVTAGPVLMFGVIRFNA